MRSLGRIGVIAADTLFVFVLLLVVVWLARADSFQALAVRLGGALVAAVAAAYLSRAARSLVRPRNPYFRTSAEAESALGLPVLATYRSGASR
jgi:hypothetical protein